MIHSFIGDNPPRPGRGLIEAGEAQGLEVSLEKILTGEKGSSDTMLSGRESSHS